MHGDDAITLKSIMASSECTPLKHAKPAKCVLNVILLVESGLSQSGS